MKDKNAMKRMEAMMKAFEKVLQIQKEEKEKIGIYTQEDKRRENELYDNGEDLFEEILMEITGHLEEAVELCHEALSVYRGDDRALGCEEDDCIMVEVHSYDEL